jgi:hypothetical protein
MSTMPDIPTINFANALDMLRVAMTANQTVLLIGDPGVGKSAICSVVAREIGYGDNFHTLLGSTLDPTDIGGLPMRSEDGKRVLRVPLDEIYQCSVNPGVLFLDEISAAPGPVQAAMLRLILERVAGNVHLHPETRIIAACNPPEQAPAGFELSAPLMGRMAVVNFRPDDTEVIEFLRTLGDDDSNASAMDKAIRDEAMLFAAVANVTPELLQIEIPKHCVNGGQPWASPRSCERMIRARAAASVIGMDLMSDSVFALTAGSMGERAATVYSGVVRMITELPSVDEIVANPEKCLCPEDKAKQVAALGLMPRIAQRNLWAAYIYAVRLRREFSLAAHKSLIAMAKYQPAITDKLTQEGIKARAKLTAMVGGPVSKAA